MAGVAVYHWRALRLKLALAGVPNPLGSFPVVHALLDVIEAMVVESAQNKGAVERFYFDIYRPPPEVIEEMKKAPEADSSFDDFAALGLQ